MLSPSHYARGSAQLDDLARELGVDQVNGRDPLTLVQDVSVGINRAFAYVRKSTAVNSPIEASLTSPPGRLSGLRPHHDCDGPPAADSLSLRERVSLSQRPEQGSFGRWCDARVGGSAAAGFWLGGIRSDEQSDGRFAAHPHRRRARLRGRSADARHHEGTRGDRAPGTRPGDPVADRSCLRTTTSRPTRSGRSSSRTTRRRSRSTTRSSKRSEVRMQKPAPPNSDLLHPELTIVSPDAASISASTPAPRASAPSSSRSTPIAAVSSSRSRCRFDERFPEYGTEHGVLPEPDPAVAVSSPLHVGSGTRRDDGAHARRASTSARSPAIAGSAQQHGSVYLNAGATAALAALDPARPLVDQVEPMLSRAVSPIWMDSSTGADAARSQRRSAGTRVWRSTRARGRSSDSPVRRSESSRRTSRPRMRRRIGSTSSARSWPPCSPDATRRSIRAMAPA